MAEGSNIIRSLFTRLGYKVDSKGAKKYDDQVKGMVAVTDSAANRIHSIAAGIGASLAAAFSVGQAKEFISTQSEAVLEIERFSAATGLNTQKLQAWSYGARKAGLSVDDFAQSMVDLGVRAAEALQDPSADMAKQFNRLGLSVTDSTGKLKDNAQLYLEFTDAIAKADKQLGTVAAVEIVDVLLSDAGTKQYGTLKKGSAAFLEMAGSAEAMATVISDEAIAATKRLNTTQLVLSGTVRGVANRFLVKLAPALEAGAGWLTRFLGDTEKVDRALGILKTTAGAAVAVFAGFKLQALTSGLVTLTGVLFTAAKSMTVTTLAAKGAKLAILGLQGAIVAIPAAAAGALLFLEDVNSLMAGGDSVVGDFIKKHEKAGGVLGGLARMLRDAAPGLASLYQRLEALATKAMPLIEQAGGALARMFIDRLAVAATFAVELLERVGPHIATAMEQLLPLVADLSDAIIKAAGPILDSAISMIDSILSLVAPLIPAVAASVGAIVKLIKLILPPVVATFAVIASVIKGLLPIALPIFSGIAAAVEGLASLLGKTFDALDSLFGPAARAIVKWLGKLDDLITPIVNKIKTVLRGASKIPGLDFLSGSGSTRSSSRRDIVGDIIASLPQDMERRAVAASSSSSSTVTDNSTTMGNVNIQLQGDATVAGADKTAQRITERIAGEAERRAAYRELQAAG